MTIIICGFLVWIGLILTAVFYDYKEYNHGRCKCGGKWKYFDTDSQGGDGYYCDKCGKVIWISWFYRNMESEKEDK